VCAGAYKSEFSHKAAENEWSDDNYSLESTFPTTLQYTQM